MVIICPPDGYQNSLRLAIDKIDMTSLEIESMGVKRAITGAQIFEIGGPNNAQKADALAAKMRGVLKDKEGVKITRPTQTAELRVRDLDDSVRCKDVARAVSSAGGCPFETVKVGEMRTFGRSLGTAWVRCPAATANRMVAAKKLRIGWVLACPERWKEDPSSASDAWKRGTPLLNVAMALTEVNTVISVESQGTSPRAARRRPDAPYAPV